MVVVVLHLVHLVHLGVLRPRNNLCLDLEEPLLGRGGEEEEEDAVAQRLHRRSEKNQRKKKTNERTRKWPCLAISMDSSVEPVWPGLARRFTPLCWLWDCR